MGNCLLLQFFILFSYSQYTKTTIYITWNTAAEMFQPGIKPKNKVPGVEDEVLNIEYWVLK